MTGAKLKAPFPYFGGKSRVAPAVWARLGRLQNYVEPFCGSCAVLLSNPQPAAIETVNDRNGHLANFWRSLRNDPEGVAHWADYPVSELDLHARGDWLFYGAAADDFVEKMRSDPDFYDVKRAGWWVWGQSCSIGSGWGRLAKSGAGVHRSLPHLGDAGSGVHRPSLCIADYFQALATRLRSVRVTCGDWTRVLGPAVTIHHGLTGVFLDPPYSHAERDSSVYHEHDENCSAAVRTWCLERGDDPLLRIALCGYADEGHEPLETAGWTVHRWKQNGGYGSQGTGRGRSNAGRETIWFSPHCQQVGFDFACKSSLASL